MKALKILTTVILTVTLLAAGLAAEAMALINYTVLNPGFYGAGEREAYELMGQTVVRKMTDAVLERAPAIALRTTDEEKAFALASEALPPEKVAGMLESSGPGIARYLILGGDIPTLTGSADFTTAETGVVKSLLMDGVWDMMPDKPSFPAFMPFTPEWNLGYGPSLEQGLKLIRFYAGMSDEALWLSLAAVVLFAGLLYLIWIRERKPFYAVMGVLFTFNGLLVATLAAAVAFFCQPIAEGSVSLYPASNVANLFTSDYPALFRAAVWPFREIFFISSLVLLSFCITMFSMGITTKKPVFEKPAVKKPVMKAELPDAGKTDAVQSDPVKTTEDTSFIHQKAKADIPKKKGPRHEKKA